jgi:hypothetical protein
MNKKMLITCIVLFGLIKVDAQNINEKDSEQVFKHSLGAGIGFTTGYGLSYRYTPSLFGVQLNFAPYHDKTIDRYSVGVTFLYTLIKNRISSLYVYQGNHYYYNSEMVSIYDPNKPYDPDPKTERKTTSYFNNGLGFGIEFIIARRIGFNLMAGYASYSNFEQLNLTGETALYYKF